MPTKALPSADDLRKLLTYEPETGKLFWKERPREMFESQRDFSAWNARFSGKEGLGSIGTNGYKHGAIKNKTFNTHRVVWCLCYGEWPGQNIDHVNGVRTDNSISNLRNVSHAENQKNQKRSKRNTSGHTGVHWLTGVGKWYAQIMAGRQKYHLGYFDRLEDAVAARRAAEREFGFHKNHGRAA